MKISNLRVGYWPLSENLLAPGDRRRAIYWAKNRGHRIVTNLKDDFDVLIATENANFNSKEVLECKKPIIFDLIDSYLSPNFFIEDLTRGIVKNISRQVTGPIRRFSENVKFFCKFSNAVICSSVEQSNIIKNNNDNVHIILDSHSEIPFINFNFHQSEQDVNILWEGQPATISSISEISSTLNNLSKDYNLLINFVTDKDYFLLLNKFGKRSTTKLLGKKLRDLPYKLTPWSLKNLVNVALKSNLSMIPIQQSIPMLRYKPENRMLIMWRLGVPCLTSAIPSYIRTSNGAGVDAVCHNPLDWWTKSLLLLNDRDYSMNHVKLGQEYLKNYHSDEILLEKWDRVVESVLK